MKKWFKDQSCILTLKHFRPYRSGSTTENSKPSNMMVISVQMHLIQRTTLCLLYMNLVVPTANYGRMNKVSTVLIFKIKSIPLNINTIYELLKRKCYQGYKILYSSKRNMFCTGSLYSNKELLYSHADFFEIKITFTIK